MKLIYTPLLALALPMMAEDGHREMDAHEHGVSKVQIAIEKENIEIHLTAPGADIVGFEYAATSGEDKDAVADAIQKLGQASNLFAFNDEAHCRVSEISAHLVGEDQEMHDGHEDDEHGHDDHDDEKDGEASHSEFHAKFMFTCDHIDELKSIDVKFVNAFENAKEVEVELVSDKGATQMEATKASPVLQIEG